MSNLISSNKDDGQEIVLTQFETVQGWKVKIDLKTRNIWVTTLDLETLLDMPEGTWKDGRTGFGAGILALRGQGLSEDRKELKLAQGGVGKCYDQDQLYVILENADCKMFKQSKKFGVYTAILQGCGLLETTKPKQLTASETIRMMLPAYELAEKNPGLGQLAQNKNKIPCLIIHNKPFRLRYWVNIHHPSLDVSRSSITRLGREIASMYRQLKLTLPMNSYTGDINRYNKSDHALICQVFNTMFEAGTL